MEIEIDVEAREQIRQDVLKKAIELFPALKGAKTSWGLNIEKDYEETRTETVGFWHPKEIEVPFTRTKECIHTHCVLNGQLSVYSRDVEYDDVAIWIGGQLERLYDEVKVSVCNPAKLGLAIGWRCAYCNTTNKAEDVKCSHCGAPRGW